jgi:hypothetical protein
MRRPSALASRSLAFLVWRLPQVALLTILALVALGLVSAAPAVAVSPNEPSDLAGRRRCPERPRRVLRSPRTVGSIVLGASREDQDREERAAAVYLIRKTRRRRTRGDRGLIGIAFDPKIGPDESLRLLLLHRARSAEPPGSVQRGRRRRHRPVRAVRTFLRRSCFTSVAALGSHRAEGCIS